MQDNQQMYAVIDLGSNTAILTLFMLHPTRILKEVYQAPQLAKDLEKGQFHPDSFKRAKAALKEFSMIMMEKDAKLVCCAGTAPFRKVFDPESYVQRLHSDTGILLTILSEENEAALSFNSVGFSLSKLDASEKMAVLDVGGGSCELATGSLLDGMDSSFSVANGCVDLTQRLLQEQLLEDGVTDKKTVESAAKEFKEAVKKHGLPQVSKLIGVAGTPGSLLMFHKGIMKFDSKAINGQVLTKQDVDVVKAKLAATPLSKKLEVCGLPQARLEMLLAGGIIVSTFMDLLGLAELTVSNGGLRFGILNQFAVKASFSLGA